MKDLGKMIYKMERVLKLWLMKVDMKDSMWTVKNKDMENINGPIRQFTKENGVTTLLMELGSIFGMMIGDIMVNGKTITCMDWVFIIL